jgi:hypothetical protein
VRRADNPTTLVCRLSRNPGALTSRTPQGHVGLFRGYFTLLLPTVTNFQQSSHIHVISQSIFAALVSNAALLHSYFNRCGWLLFKDPVVLYFHSCVNKEYKIPDHFFVVVQST